MATQSHTQLTFVPDDFYCPISGDLMVDPVSDSAGHTYEKDQIMRWLQMKQTSPITNLPLHDSDLSPNLAMKRSIEAIRGKLSADQLKVDSRIAEMEHKPFIDTMDLTEVKTYYHDSKLIVSVTVPDVDVRPPVDLVLCIDVSGSMGTEATLKGSSGETIHNGISVLSLTIAAAKTIISSLNEHDNLSVVTYTDKAKTIIQSMSCTDTNKATMNIQLDQLRPLNTTNIWSGIQLSMDILRSTSPECRNKSIFLLTDGVPNIVPPRGHEAMIEKYKRQNNFICPINCYGFGYDLDSPLLDTISRMTGGDGYAFIPDSSLLGNIFIHGISNLLTTAMTNKEINITLCRDVQFTDRTQEKSFIINSLKYGQTRDFIFDIEGEDDDNDFAIVSMLVGDEPIVSEEVVLPDINYFHNVLYRHRAIDVMDSCHKLQKFNEAEQVKRLINPFIQSLQEDLSLKASPFIQDMLVDFEGQVRESLNMTAQGLREDWYTKWGKHYLPSLISAYQNQLCVNFKDKGISHFGGSLFKSIRDEVSDIFDTLPPPKQDIKHTTYRGGHTRGGQTRGGQTRNMASAPVNMRAYNNPTGGCCSHHSLIQDDNMINIPVKDLTKGSKVMTYDENGYYTPSEIECVIRTTCPGENALMVQIDDLQITPYHPIKKNNKWVFPIMLGQLDLINTPYMYSFVTKNRKSVIINDYIYATWGHELKGNVIEHEYYGSKVIDDIKKFPGYKKGLVCLENNMIKRGKDNKVCKIEQNLSYACL
tara:strand:+ start:2946 stop:5219 length:2274 start_codon:yes stop_codon:yes gene_type:complete